MSAPLIWIFIPAGVAILLWILQRRERLVIYLATGLCLALILVAWLVPIGKPANLGILTAEIDPSLIVLGRKFILSASDRFFLILIYSIGAIWFLAARQAGVHSYFVPAGLLFLTMMVAAQAVEPFLYAALLIEIGVLLSVPILSPPQGGRVQGVQRFLVFQTMALPFVLLAGWAAGVVEINPANSPLLTQATLLLAMGFALWLAVFPFNTWIPSMTAQTHPFLSGFILTVFLSEVYFLCLYFLDGFSWLRSYPYLPILFQAGGVVTIVTGGIWAAFQSDLRRLMGYGFIIESGYALLSFSLGFPTGVQLFTISLVPRLIGFAVWSLGLSILQSYQNSLTFDGISGALKKYPFATLSVAIAYFSSAGVPLLAGYPVRQVLLESLAQISSPAAIWVFIGNLGFIGGGIRMLISMVGGEETPFEIKEKKLEIVLLMIGVAVLIFIGLFPHLILPIWTNMADVFERLK